MSNYKKNEMQTENVLSGFSPEFIDGIFSTDPISRHVINCLINGKDPFEMIEFLLKERKKMEEIQLVLIDNYSSPNNFKSVQEAIEEVYEKYKN